MGLKKLAAKVADYNERFEQGKASKIKPSHVERVLEKLLQKAVDLRADIATADSPEKKARIEKKLGVATAQIERAKWLLKEIS